MPRTRRTLAQLERELALLKAKHKAEAKRARADRRELRALKRLFGRVCRKALRGKVAA